MIAASGYPEQPRTGDAIHIPPAPSDVLVFHAGTRRSDDGTLTTAGGRVLAVTGLAATMEDAQRLSQRFASSIDFAGKQLRTDIGWRELTRGVRS